MELEAIHQYIEDLHSYLGKDLSSFVITGNRVELEGYGSLAEIRLDENSVLCTAGAFTRLPQGMFLRDCEYVIDSCRALSDTRGRIKRINYLAQDPFEKDWIANLGLRFEQKGWNAFDTSDNAINVIQNLGALIAGMMKGSCSVTHHQVDIDYPQPLKTRPIAFRFRTLITHHGTLLYSQDITIKNV